MKSARTLRVLEGMARREALRRGEWPLPLPPSQPPLDPSTRVPEEYPSTPDTRVPVPEYPPFRGARTGVVGTGVVT